MIFSHTYNVMLPVVLIFMKEEIVLFFPTAKELLNLYLKKKQNTFQHTEKVRKAAVSTSKLALRDNQLQHTKLHYNFKTTNPCLYCVFTCTQPK